MTQPTLLIIGASRGLGHAMTEEFLQRHWNVVGTVRGTKRTPLHELAERYPNRVDIEQLDINDPEQLSALRYRLANRRFDMLFVNAGTTNHQQHETIGETSTAEFMRVMMTNALSPMRVIETLDSLVTSDGLIGVMSSGQGSLTNNTRGGREVYRGSKAALNQYMRSYAARPMQKQRPMALIAPGWIRTELGGSDAPLSIEESVPGIVDALLAKRQRPGLEYLDREGQTVPW